MSMDLLPRQAASRGEREGRRLAIIGVKALCSIGLIAFLGSRLDYAKLPSYWHALNGFWILGALAVLLVEMCLLAGIRLKLMLFYVDARRPLTTTVRIALCGFFFEQVTIGFVGGDAIRLWSLKRTAVPFGLAVQALLLDRTIGFASIVFLSLLGMHALLPLVDEAVRSVIVGTLVVVVVAGCIGTASVFALARSSRLPRLTAFWQRLGPRGKWANGAALAIVFFLAIATHLFNVLVLWMLGESLGLTMTLYQWFIVAPTVLLISMLPISVGGWGIREGAMVVILHGFGIPTEDAILPSILFGTCAALATLPGGMFWVLDKKSYGEKTD
jgi:uncharacterized membrane protein YbhN (UPF0104 family)